MKKIPFMKFSGAGNDFIVIDNRDRVIQPKAMASFVSHVCRHHLSVGADGLIFIEKSRKADFRWRFFNDDGGEATFCGNGARRAARFAYLKKIAPKAMRFEGTAGTVDVTVTTPGGTTAAGLGAMEKAGTTAGLTAAVEAAAARAKELM